MAFYAHSANPQGARQPLEEHLRAVAVLTSSFAAATGAAEAGHFLGLWHDLGKFSPDFQQYLLAAEAGLRARGPDHKGAGALLAAGQGSLAALALLIEGHHGGLRSLAELKSWLAERRGDPALAEALRLARETLPDLIPSARLPLPAHVQADPLAAELFLRLLFSALVDADYLDTEHHFSIESAVAREAPATVADLWPALERAQAALSGHGTDAVSAARHAIYQACLRAADLPPGLFRLTVPTGGGKTRSALAFALRHALRHGQERVIVAIPYISITEQTADVYRSILGADAVLEHHSAAFAQNDDDSPAGRWARLAAENWDTPVVVTTTVQLFESLFASRPARARKVHRLANSVIILDEAQALPPHLLAPALDALRGLSEHYHTSVVFSTATQPAFEAIPAFRDLQAAEIVPEPGRFFAQLKRVAYDWLLEPQLEWSQVADLMRGERQALAVLNTKGDALALLDALGDDDALHLSTLLCGAHRRRVLAEVRRRLAAGKPCRLVATQVVEAGVDLDFPTVLRALGPLDSIIQAAGRCNREGRLAAGRVIVFAPREARLPPGAYAAGTGVTRALLAGGGLDMHDPAAPAAYFARLYGTISADRAQVQARRRAFDFPAVAEAFRLIPDDTEAVVVPYGPPGERELVEALLSEVGRQRGAPRRLFRALQPYIVAVRRREALRYRRSGLIADIAPGLGQWVGGYHPVRGLTGEDVDPEALIV